MKTKTTAIWFVLAAALAAFIWIFDHHFQPAAPVVSTLLPGLRPAEVTGIQVIPVGTREIGAGRTNGVWQLQRPVVYPAQAAGIETLLAVLEKLMPALPPLTAGELRGHKNVDAEFGFENKQFSIAVEAGDQRWQLLIGNRTAPGDQVFVRVVGVDDVFVTDAAWLQFLPRTANDWRDTSLVDVAGACDWIVITNGAKVIELRCNPTNHLWNMTRPLQARADGSRIAAALQQLRSARVTQFVNDDPKDPAAFGLQPADLDLWLGSGTNYMAAVHAGKSPADNPAQLYVRREGWNSIVAVAKDALAPWRGAVNDFRDAHLLAPVDPVAEIEVGGENSFTLQRHGAKDWALAGEKFPIDAENVQTFLKLLGDLRASEFKKDRNTAADLQDFGLVAPARQISLRAVAGATNSVLAQLLFGVTTNGIFVKRADEYFVYALAETNFNRLPENGWEFRERRVWSFSTNDVVQLTIRQDGKIRQIVRDQVGKWSLAPGSQGVLDGRWLDQIIGQFGEMSAVGWVARNFTSPEKLGFTAAGLQIAIELKDGRKLSVDFGPEVRSEAGLAAVTLEGERWAFVCPSLLYQFARLYLAIPPNTP